MKYKAGAIGAYRRSEITSPSRLSKTMSPMLRVRVPRIRRGYVSDIEAAETDLG